MQLVSDGEVDVAVVLSLEPDHLATQLGDQVFARAGRRPHRVIEVSTPHTGLPFVASGVGLSVVTAGVAEHLPGMTSLELEGGFPDLTLMAVWRRGITPTPPVEHFLGMLVDGRGVPPG